MASVPATAKLDTQLNPTGEEWPALPDLFGFTNVSPRVGANFKLDGSGKTVAKASYGRYYGRINTGMFSAIAPGNTPTVALLYNPVTGQFDRPFFTVSPNSNYAVDHDLRTSTPIRSSSASSGRFSRISAST
jgi:hypothetical protein